MNTESSSERYANSFQASTESVAEGTAGSAPVISQADQVASVNYRPGDVAKPASTVGEVSTAIPIFTPAGVMSFQDWAVFGYNSEGKSNVVPDGVDYKPEPSYSIK